MSMCKYIVKVIIFPAADIKRRNCNRSFSFQPVEKVLQNELTFCHADHKVILRWGCFRRSNIIAFENLSQISKMVLIFLGQRSNPAGFICMPLHLTEIFKSLLIHH